VVLVLLNQVVLAVEFTRAGRASRGAADGCARAWRGDPEACARPCRAAADGAARPASVVFVGCVKLKGNGLGRAVANAAVPRRIAAESLMMDGREDGRLYLS
jgi:hypothetical protein